MAADLTIVVVTYNSAHVVGDLLDSLPGALAGLSAAIVVVDNGSSDGTAELLDGRPDCTLVRNSNTGYAGGLNVGVREAPRTPAIMVLNPDVRLAPGAVRALHDALSLPDTAVTAPRVLNPDGSLHHSLRREPSIGRTLGLTATAHPWFAEYMTRDREYESPAVVDWALGAALLISRDVYDELGGWDESFFLYSEETDFCLRARDRGLATRYVPAAVAVHIGGQSGQSEQTHMMQTVNRVRLYHRRHGPTATYAFLALTATREALWAAKGGVKNRAALVALFRPRKRPGVLGCSDRLLPT